MPPRKRALSQATLAPFLAGATPKSKRAATQEEEVDPELSAALAASLEEAHAHTVCPLCGETFSNSTVQRHASTCGEAEAFPSAAPAAGWETTKAPTSPNDVHPDAALHAADADGLSQDGPHLPAPATLASPARCASPQSSAETRKAKLHCSYDEGNSTSVLRAAALHQSRETSANKVPARSGAKARKAPFYKILEGMPIAVDAFSYGAIDGCKAYILTHFHADHYGGLSAKWNHGPIYCSAPTARLVCHKLGVHPSFVHALPMDRPTPLPHTGVQVTCVDANHCPGSCIMLFEGPQTARPYTQGRMYRYLHCGDFRACPRQVRHPALQQTLDIVYLDTTYLNPRYCFPAQPEVIGACTDLVHALALGETPKARQGMLSWYRAAPRPTPPTALLVVVGTYSIGKENLAIALAQAMRTSIYCVDARKYQTYAQLQDPVLNALLTHDPIQARVHVTNLFALSPTALREWAASLRDKGMPVEQTLAFRPTGWSFRGGDRGVRPDLPFATLLLKLQPRPFDRHALVPTRDSTADTQVYSVPYSEHSSFYELMAFMVSLPHRRIIPTVNVGSEASRTRMRRWTDVWTRAARRHAEHPLVQPRSDCYW